jgi:hypothetical protein
MQNANNYGFVSWLDDEWPETMKNELRRLWSMYHLRNFGDKLDHSRFVEDISKEKGMLQKKYYSMLSDVQKFVAKTKEKVHQENYQKIRNNS